MILRQKPLIDTTKQMSMAELPWNQEIINWFANHRVDWLTSVFQFFTFLGNEMGYIIIIVLLYWLYDKRIAIQVLFATLTTTLINHTLKIIIRNPRPFVTEGTYREKWAIPEGDIEETAHSFSTPSGHAQGSSTFWWYLHLKVKSRLTFILLPIMVFFIGFSRVYLGVHYLEDVILGWIIGFIIVIFLYRYDNTVEKKWKQLSRNVKYVLAIVVPLLITIIAGVLSGYSPDGSGYVTLAGIFSGITIGVMLDSNQLNFSPSFSGFDSIPSKIVVGILRMIIGLFLVGIVLIGLDQVFALIAPDDTFLGFLLRWFRYSLVTFTGSYLAPLIFVNTKLASQSHENTDQ